MENKVLIAPSILSANFVKMEEEIKKIELAGADIIHCDIMDGVFVNNISFGIKMISDIRKITKLPLDVHLMIVNPQNYVERFAEAGADFITVHYEACKDSLQTTLQKIKDLKVRCGLVINPDTPVTKVSKLMEMCDIILLMSVFPGFGGQKYINSVTDKIIEVKKIVNKINKKILIEVDGGITEENVSEVKKAGANIIVAGSTVFKSQDMLKTIYNLRFN